VLSNLLAVNHGAIRAQKSFNMTVRTTFLLTTIVAVSFLTIAATSSVVRAQQGACVSDINTHCAGSKGESRAACIRMRFKDFSLGCQLALVKARAVRKACTADVKKNCADIKPGRGRIEACLKDHFADVSDQCKETISQSAGKS
jgi:Cysteine rich repeat